MDGNGSRGFLRLEFCLLATQPHPKDVLLWSLRQNLFIVTKNVSFRFSCSTYYSLVYFKVLDTFSKMWSFWKVSESSPRVWDFFFFCALWKYCRFILWRVLINIFTIQIVLPREKLLVFADVIEFTFSFLRLFLIGCKIFLRDLDARVLPVEIVWLPNRLQNISRLSRPCM